jgi:hypothetical protein
MNCAEFQRLLDDHFDSALDAQIEAELLTHAAACGPCASRRALEWHLRRSLQALPVATPSAGFADRVLSHALASRAGSATSAGMEAQGRIPLWTIAAALAASLALALGLWVIREPAPAARSELPIARVQPAAAAGVQPVRLVFRSGSALSNVTIELGLPEGVELAGYPGQRRLVWQSDLQAGTNLLELPVLLHGQGGVLTATLNHGTERRRFSVRVVSLSESDPGVTSAPPDAGTGAAPAPLPRSLHEEHRNA